MRAAIANVYVAEMFADREQTSTAVSLEGSSKEQRLADTALITAAGRTLERVSDSPTA
jgi:hypothetical protein